MCVGNTEIRERNPLANTSEEEEGIIVNKTGKKGSGPSDPLKSKKSHLKDRIGPIFFFLLEPMEIDRKVQLKQVGFSCFFKSLTSKRGHLFGPISSIKINLKCWLPGICAFNL